MNKVPQREKARGINCFGNLVVIISFATTSQPGILAHVRKGLYKQTIQMVYPLGCIQSRPLPEQIDVYME